MIVSEGVVSIRENSFRFCDSHSRVTIPPAVTRIEAYTFSHCSSLKSMKIPEGIVYIGSYAFNGCSKLTRVSLPASLTAIERSAFNWTLAQCTFEVPRESVAARYCEENGFHYTYPDSRDWLLN